MCTIPVVRAFCRESYNDPAEVYERLKRMGMDLVTVTDHDSIDAAESLRKHPDFFLSEEVTCRLPSGTELHVGVYDITERQHVEIARRSGDFARLSAYLDEQRLLFSANHVLSRLTGRRSAADFELFARAFPLIETLNGHMPRQLNRDSARLAKWMGKPGIGGSDAHALRSAGLAFTEVPGARNKHEFFQGLRRGHLRVAGESGRYSKLTRDVFSIAGSMLRERPALLPLAAAAVGVPLVTAVNLVLELAFSRMWMSRLERENERAGRISGAGVPEGAAA